MIIHMNKYMPYIESFEFSAELLTKACKEVMRKIHKEMNFKITHEEFILLEVICLFPGIIQGEIVKKIFMQRNYVCKLLSKLEGNGYITRKKTILGKRQIILNNFITDKGKEEYERIKTWISNEYAKKDDKEIIECRQFAQFLYKTALKIVKDYNVKF